MKHRQEGVLLPLGSWSGKDLPAALDATDSKMAPTLGEDEEILQQSEYIRMAGRLQEKLKALHMASGRAIREPSTCSFEEGIFVPRSHWAADSPAFNSMPREEQRWLKGTGFSIDSPPFDLYSVMSLEADEAGAAVPGEGRTKSSLSESLKHSPCMSGCQPSVARASAPSEKQANLVPGQKPESGRNSIVISSFLVLITCFSAWGLE